MKPTSFIFIFILFLTILIISAEENSAANGLSQNQDNGYSYKSVNDFTEAIPSLNQKLQVDNIQLPGSAGFLVRNGNLHIRVLMNDNSTNNFYFVAEEKMINGIIKGIPETSAYMLSTDEKTTQNILSSEDIPGSILQAYDEGKIELDATGFSNNVKLFFAKFLLWFYP